MARCWVLRKRTGLVLLLQVWCAVRMMFVGVGVGLSLFSGLLLRSRVGRARCCCYLLVRVVVVRGAVGVGVWWVARALGHRTALLVAGGLGLSGLLSCGRWVG